MKIFLPGIISSANTSGPSLFIHDLQNTRGMSFHFSKTDPFIQGFIKRHTRNYSPNGEFVRFTELYNRYTEDDKGLKVIKNRF